MRRATGWASGKLILAGEHAVVHGQPALAFAVDLGTTVTLERAEGPTRLLGLPDDPRLMQAVLAVFEPEGWQIGVQTTLPIGRGMGSSASLAVALVRARRAWTGDDTDVFDDALSIERVFHHDPSGVDVAVAVRGGVLRFERGRPPAMRSLPCPSWQAVVIDTGKVGVTSALVAAVTARRPGIDGVLERIGQLVDEAIAVLDDPRELGPLLTENHRLLDRIGVSTPELDGLVQLALDQGAHGAKLSGAGGGGVVLALVDDPAPLVAAAAAKGYDAWAVRPSEAP